MRKKGKRKGCKLRTENCVCCWLCLESREGDVNKNIREEREIVDLMGFETAGK